MNEEEARQAHARLFALKIELDNLTKHLSMSLYPELSVDCKTAQVAVSKVVDRLWRMGVRE